jgi:hypothetical protein
MKGNRHRKPLRYVAQANGSTQADGNSRVVSAKVCIRSNTAVGPRCLHAAVVEDTRQDLACGHEADLRCDR